MGPFRVHTLAPSPDRRTRAGGLGAPVKGVGGQGKYTRLVGAGDLNGDGKGGFSPRVKIGTGLGAYNILAVPGDLTADGRPDLVARDTAGNLWRWTGTASGTFTGRTRIATGWSGYLYLTCSGDLFRCSCDLFPRLVPAT